MWGEMRDLPTRVSNMIRRGFLIATYNDRKLLTARVRTGVDDEDDRLDVLQPVGFSSHIAPGPRVEIFTCDVGSDASRRVLLCVLGDRADHPHPEQGEVLLYTPGDPTRYLRIKKTGSGGRDAGLEISVGDIPVTIRTDKTVLVEAADGVIIKTPTVRIEGDVRVTGEVTARADTAPVNFSSHTHGGVEPGGASTARPNVGT